VRQLDPRVIDAVYAAVEALLPARPPTPIRSAVIDPGSPTADKVCFTGIVYRLALGCSWVDAGRLVGIGQATLRRRRDQLIAAGSTSEATAWPVR
jgi:transposase